MHFQYKRKRSEIDGRGERGKYLLALVAVMLAVVKVPQNCCAASKRVGFLNARRQLSALQLAVTALADKSTWAKIEKNDGILVG